VNARVRLYPAPDALLKLLLVAISAAIVYRVVAGRSAIGSPTAQPARARLGVPSDEWALQAIIARENRLPKARRSSRQVHADRFLLDVAGHV